MGIARRWTMAGPWRHPNGIFYLRRELPKDIWESRGKLAEFGIKIGGKELRRSLGTRDPKFAAETYLKFAAEQESVWASWREALAKGPAVLSERNIAAIAGQRAKSFLRRYEDDPDQAPRPPPRPDPELSAATIADVSRLAEADSQRLRQELVRALEAVAAGAQLSPLLTAWRRDSVLSILIPLFVEPLADTLEAEHGAELDRLVMEAGQAITRDSRSGLLLRAARLQAQARETLQTMSEESDFREPEWAKGVPEFRPPEQPSASPKRTFEGVIDAEATKRGLGRDGTPMREKTVRKYKSICAQFAKFRGEGGTNPTTIKADELERWKHSLLENGKVGNRTVNYKLGAVKTVVRWGRGLYKDEFTGAVAELGEVELPDFVPKPSDQSAIHPDEAVTILRAARREAEARKRWLPWICAYTGLRIAEASQLEKGDFFESEGHWFFGVSVAGKRSLKTVNARRTIPVHRALLDEGFRKFVDEAPAGRLFVSGADTLVRRWVRSKSVGLTREELSPNHGWRHLFEDLCRRYELTDDARHYLTGHSTGGADQGYGRTRAMLPGLWRQIEKIEPFKIG